MRELFLCESCGYPLGGISDDSRCPECGTSVASSLPTARPGTPFQRRPTLSTWLTTMVASCHPSGRVFRSMMIESRRSTWLRRLNLTLASVLLTLAAIGWLDVWRSFRFGNAWAAWFIAVTPFFAYAFFSLLTWVERTGVNFFSRRKGWRVTRECAIAACAHASVGWVIAGGLAAAPFLFTRNSVMPDVDPLTRLLMVADYVQTYPRLAIASSSGFVLGLLVFESLTWLCIRRCKFANPPGAVPPGVGLPDVHTKADASG